MSKVATAFHISKPTSLSLARYVMPRSASDLQDANSLQKKDVATYPKLLCQVSNAPMLSQIDFQWRTKGIPEADSAGWDANAKISIIDICLNEFKVQLPRIVSQPAIQIQALDVAGQCKGLRRQHRLIGSHVRCSVWPFVNVTTRCQI